MCLQLLALAATLAGTGASVAAARQQESEMEKAVKRSLQQQQGFKRRGKEVYAKSLEEGSPAAAKRQIGEGTQEARELYERVQQVPLGQSSSAAVTPANKAVDTQRQSNYSRLIGEPNAQMQGLTNYNLQQWIKNLQAQTQFGVNTSLSQGAAGVLPYRLQDAQNSAAGLQGIGSLLSTIGNVAGIAGGVNRAPTYNVGGGYIPPEIINYGLRTQGGFS